MAPVTRVIRAAAAAALVVGGLNALTIAPAEAAAKPCTIVGTNDDDLLRGTDGDDVICALGGDDKVLGLAGNDVLRGGGGDDVLRGGSGDDVVAGGRGDDRIFGQGGNDIARGDGGDDEITGGPGNDRMGGFKGADTLRGIGDPGSLDDMRCGPGPDTASGDPGDRVRPDCEGVAQNDPPTDITLDPSTISENEFSGTDIGDLETDDPDVGDEITFTLVPGAGSADNDQVEIDGDSLESAEEYDFEAQSELSVRVRATDAAGESVEEALVVTITDVNDPPVAVDDDASTPEDTKLELPLTGPGSPAANDTDQDGDSLAVVDVANESGGQISLVSDVVRFVPDENLCGDDAGSFDYEVSDGNGGSDMGTVTVDITCVDDVSTADDDAVTVVEDSNTTTVNVLANDDDPENDPITVAGVGSASNGTTGFTSANVTYTPAANYCGPDAFTYTISGGDVANVAVTVTCVNDAPVAVDDDRTATEDTDLSNPVTGAGSPAANDTDVESDTLTVTSVSNPTGGTVQITAGQVVFAPTANLCGTDAGSYDYVVGDGNGGTDTGTVTIDITCVNDPPVAVNDARTVAEDSGETTFSTLLANDTDVEDDPITITDASNPPNGSTTFSSSSVTYSPDADFCGADSFTYTVNGGDTATVNVTVTCANDAPDLDLDTTTGGNNSLSTFVETEPHTGTGVLIAPNAGITDVDDAQINGATATLEERPDGDANESLSFTSPPSSGITGDYVPATGTLTLSGAASKADYAAAIASIRYDNTVNPPGAADRTVLVQVTDEDSDSPVRTATVQIDVLNNPPVNTVPGALTVPEDGTISFTSGISISVADSDGGPLTVQVTVTHGTFTLSGTTGLTVAGDGTSAVTLSGSIAAINAALNNSTYAPTNNYNGPAQLTIDTSDGVDSDNDTVAITVTSVNDAPTATNLNAGETYTEDITRNLVDIVVSDVDSTTVTATLTLAPTSVGSLTTATSGSTTSTFSSGVWSANGPIAQVNALLAGVSYVPAPNFNASFSIATSVSDGSGSVGGTKVMTGNAVNDLPNAVNDSGATDEDNTLFVVAPGVLGNDTDADASDTKTVIKLAGTATLTQTLPSGAAVTINANGSYSYNPGAAFQGLSTGQSASDSFTYTMQDGAGAESTATVTITISGISDAPTAVADSFDAIGNTGLFVGTSRPASQGGKEITGSVLDNDTDPDTPAASLVAEPVTNAPTTLGGTITVQADGNFTYHPDDVDTGVTDTFTYRVCDDSPCNSGTVANATGTLSLPIAGQVWYVRNNESAGGDGTSDTPFDTLAEAEAASGTGDTVFVFDGTNTTTNLDTGYAMNASERLIGESRPLSLDPDGGGPLGTSALFPGTSGAQPTLTASNEDVIALASNVLVDGVDLDPSGTGGGISGGAGTADVTVQNVNVTDTGAAGTQPGIEMDGTTGINRFTGVTVTNGGSATAIGVRINNADRVLFADTATNSIATAGAKALDAASTNLLTSRWNDITVTGSGTGAIRLSSTTGTPVLGDGAGTDLSLQTTSGSTAALAISSSTVTVDSAGADTISAIGGPAVSITGAGSYAFDDVDSTNSASDGISLASLSGSFSAGSGSSITNATIDGLVAFQGNGNITYDGTINSSSSVGSPVEVISRTGGTVDFNGMVTGTGLGLTVLSNAAGSTTRFDGGLSLSTGSGVGLTTTSGGTLVVTDPNGPGVAPDNTLTTTSGIPLYMTGTTIGADGMTFRSISSSGAPSGITLTNTGSVGGLTVTGNGGTCASAATCSGGAIQNSTGDGVSLTSVGGGVSLTRMSINGGGDDGVDASSVTGLTVDSSRVVNNGNAADEEGISLANVAGTVAVTSTEVTGSAYNNLRLQNTSGTISSLALTGSKFNNNSATTGNHGALVDIGGTATLTTATVSTSEFKDNFSIGLQVVATGSGAINSFTINGNTFSGTSTGATTGTQEIAIDASKSGTSNATFLIQNNTITGHNSHGMNLFSAAGAGTGGQLRARVVNNTIGSAAVVSSGSQIGNCLRVNLNGDSADTVLVGTNTLRQCPNGRGIEVIGRNGTGLKDVTITNNDVNPNDTSGFPLSAILAQSNCVSVCATLRTNVSGNTVPAGTSFDLGAGFLALIETGASTLQLVGVGTCATQLAGSNTGSTSASAGCATIAGPIGTPP